LDSLKGGLFWECANSGEYILTLLSFKVLFEHAKAKVKLIILIITWKKYSIKIRRKCDFHLG
jgi:hypothetical protein